MGEEELPREKKNVSRDALVALILRCSLRATESSPFSVGTNRSLDHGGGQDAWRHGGAHRRSHRLDSRRAARLA